MKIPSIDETTREERVWAALTHVSVILTAWGFVFPLMIWAVQRKKSAFIAFHALQALTYQLFQMPFWLLWSLTVPFLTLPLFIFVIAASIRQTGDLPFFLPFVMQFGFIGLMFCGFGLFFLPALLGMILIFSRRDFYYPLFGQWLKGYLSAESTR